MKQLIEQPLLPGNSTRVRDYNYLRQTTNANLGQGKKKRKRTD